MRDYYFRAVGDFVNMLYNIGNVIVGDNTTVSRKSENAVASSHVLRFLFDTEPRFITAQVQASMRDRCYKDVSAGHAKVCGQCGGWRRGCGRRPRLQAGNASPANPVWWAAAVG